MATDNKSSILVDELLPEFLETEGPKFKSFVRAYYEFLETTGEITERSKNLLNYADIDKTNTEFLKYFDREILANFPQEILANKKLVAARIKELYRAKGSEQAYKMLFRMLFDDEIEFYYPGQDILRVSDGRWVQENSLRLSAPFTGNLFTIGGRNIEGASSGATAIVERVIKTTEQGVDVFEIFISNIKGIFQDTEIIQTSDGTLSGVVLSSIGPLQGIIVNFGGSSHRVGDIVSLTSSSGSGSRGTVLQVDDSSIIPLIVNGGSGYTTNAIVVLVGGSGTGAEFQIDNINNTQVLFTYNDIISALQNTRINANTFSSSNSSTISANLAIASVSTVLSAALGTTPLTVGTISAMSAVTRGSGYSNTNLPVVEITEPAIAEQLLNDGSGGIKGFNANVVANNIGGSIVRLRVDVPGAGYARADPITVTNLTRSAQNATGSALVSGIVNYSGKYTDTKGFVSWNNKLQDNVYYQQFSYVIRSQQNVDTYREIVKKLLHPAGTNLFGDLLIQSNAAISFSSNTFITYAIEFTAPGPISSVVSFGTTTLNHRLTANSVGSALVFGTTTLDHRLTANSVPSTLVFGTTTLDRTLTANSVASTIVFGTSIVARAVSPVAIASTATISNNAELVHIIDYSSIASTVNVSANAQLQLTIDPASMASSANVGLPALFRGMSPVAIASTASLSNDAELVHIIDYSSIGASPLVFNSGTGTISNFFVSTVDDLSTEQIALYSDLSINSVPGNKIFDGIGTAFTTQLIPGNIVVVVDVNNTNNQFTLIVDSVSSNTAMSVTSNVVHSNSSFAIVNNATFLFVSNMGTSIVGNNTQLVRVIDYSSVTSTVVVSANTLLQTSIDPTSTLNNSIFGTSIFDRTTNLVAVTSTATVSSNAVMALTIDCSSIISTVNTGTALLLRSGTGTITNFFVSTVDDLSAEQIAKYSNLNINSVPGNKIFDGTGTAFTSELVQGTTIIVIDVNDTNEEFTLTVDSISGNTAMSVTANVVYSNSSFAIVNNAIYLYS
jgi:hypothetical protein